MLLLPNSILILPPALKKYLAALADAKVIVWVNVIVHAVDPDPVAVVLDTDPVKVPYCVPLAAALPLLVVNVFKSVLRLARIVIVSPATGAVRDVMVVP